MAAVPAELALRAKQNPITYRHINEYLSIAENYVDDETIKPLKISWSSLGASFHAWLIPFELRNKIIYKKYSCVDFNRDGSCTSRNCKKRKACLICGSSHKFSECPYFSKMLSEYATLLGRSISYQEGYDGLLELVRTCKQAQQSSSPLSELPPTKTPAKMDTSNTYQLGPNKELVCDFIKAPDIGSTAYADVYRAVLRCHLYKEEKPVAVKRYKTLLAKGRQVKRDQLKEEVKFLQKSIHSEHTVALIDFMFEKNQAFIVMDLLDGNLAEYIKKCHHFTNPAYARFVKDATKQLLDAYTYIHSIGIFHRDVKPQNILYSLDEEGAEFPKLKLCDFAFSRWKNDMQSSISSTTCIVSTNDSIRWSPPEMKFGLTSSQHQPEKVDIWSLGHVLFYTAVRGRSGIFAIDSNFDNHDSDVEAAIVKCKLSTNFPLLTDLIKQMMLKDPTKRKAIKEFSDHPSTWYGKDFRGHLERLYRLKERQPKLESVFLKYIRENVTSNAEPWSNQMPLYVFTIIKTDSYFGSCQTSSDRGAMVFFWRNLFVHHLRELVDDERTQRRSSSSSTLAELEALAEDRFLDEMSKRFPEVVFNFAIFMKSEIDNLTDEKLKKFMQLDLQSSLVGPQRLSTEAVADYFLAAIKECEEDIVACIVQHRPDIMEIEKTLPAIALALENNLRHSAAFILGIYDIFARDKVPLLAHAGIKKSADNGCSVVQLAARKGNFDFIKAFIKLDPSAILWTDRDDRNLLHTIAELADEATVVEVLKMTSECSKANVQDKNGNKPIHYTCRNGKHPQVVALFLELKSYNLANKAGETPLIVACMFNNVAAVDQLLEYYAKSSDTRSFEAPLHQLFIGASDNGKGNTPLHYAYKSGNDGLIELLLRYKADASRKNLANQTPAAMAQKKTS